MVLLMESWDRESPVALPYRMAINGLALDDFNEEVTEAFHSRGTIGGLLQDKLCPNLEKRVAVT
jgi:hypothetical protein